MGYNDGLSKHGGAMAASEKAKPSLEEVVAMAQKSLRDAVETPAMEIKAVKSSHGGHEMREVPVDGSALASLAGIRAKLRP